MRIDEEYAKNAIIKYFLEQEIVIDISNGEDPPDYWVRIKDVKVLLEVTQGHDGYYDGNRFISRRSCNEPILNISDWLNENIGDNVPNNKTLYMYIEGPVNIDSKFKWKLKEQLCIYLESVSNIASNYNQEKNIKIQDIPVLLKIIARSNSRSRSISCFTKPRSSLLGANIEINVQKLLEHTLIKKEMAMNKVNFKGERWLAIINQYILADSSTYKCALSKIKVLHNFSRIFLVEEDIAILIFDKEVEICL